MAGIQRITGGNSGLDVDSLVKASLTTEQSKIDRETQNQKILEYQQEQYKKIISDASDFYDKHFDVLKTGNILSSNTYKSVSFKSDDDAIVTAQGFAGADVSNYKVAVTQLASKASHTFTSDDFGNVLAKQEGVMAVKVGDKNVYVDVAFNEDTSIDMATTAKNLNTLLSNNGIDVTAKYSEFSKGIILESGKLGESVSFQAGIEESITKEEIVGGTSFDDSKYSTYEGKNAKGTITKGTEVYNIDKNSNVVTVDNVQFTLKALSTTTLDNLTHLTEGAGGTTTTTSTVTTTSSADGKTTTITTSADGTANLLPLTEGAGGTTTTKIITDGTKTTTIAADGTKTTTLADGTTSLEHLTEGTSGTTTTATTTDGTKTTKKIATISSDGTSATTKTITTSGDGKTTTITTSSNGTTNLLPENPTTTTTTKTTKTITDGTTTTTEIIEDGTTTITKTVNPTIGKVTQTINDGTTTTTNSYESATLTGSRDVTALKDTIVSFVNDYNTLLSSINTKLYEDRNTDYRPLTDAQKKEMTDDEITAWEKKAQTGLLKNDSNLQRIASAMKRAMSSVMSGSGLYLEKIGIKPVDNYQEKNGMFTIDEDKLTTALEENAEGIKDLFTRNSSTTDKGGIFVQLKSTLYDEFKTSTSTLAKKVGMDGTSTQYSNTLTRAINDKKTLISELNKRYSNQETSLYNKYSRLEAALENLSAQQSSLASMLGTY